MTTTHRGESSRGRSMTNRHLSFTVPFCLSIVLLGIGISPAICERQEASGDTGSGSGIPPTPVQPVECNGTQYMISNSSCADCNCHVNGSTSTSCEDTSGACLCRRDAYGLKCNMCRSGFYQPISADVYTARCWQTCQYNAEAFCQACLCNPYGTNGTSSCSDNGQCGCVRGYTGTRCDDCVYGYIYNRSRSCVAAPSFYFAFGGMDDARINRSSGPSQARVSVPTPFHVGRNTYTEFWISRSGFISTVGNTLYNDTSAAVIAPFYTADGTVRASQVAYRVSTSASDLRQVNMSLANEARNFSPRYALIVTWIRVSNGSEPGNTYQVVLTTDGCVTYAILNYLAESIYPTSSTQVFVRNMQQLAWEATPSSLGTRSVAVPLTGPCQESQQLLLCRERTSALTAVSVPTNSLCPLTLQHAMFDSSFSRIALVNGVCFADVFGGSLGCCYDDGTGAYLSEGTMASFVSESSPLFMPMTFMMEWQLRANCCEAGFCDLFYAIRPNLVNVDTQAGSEALRIAELTRIRQTTLGNGDPHFISMDGQRFSFNGLGEYMLMDAYDATSDTSVVVQIRTQLVLASGATSVSAFAAGFYTGRFPSGSQQSHIQAVVFGNSVMYSSRNNPGTIQSIVNMARSTSGTPVMLDNVTAVQYMNNQTTFTFPTGAAISISLVTADALSFLAIQTTVNARYRNATKGLLGRLNSDVSDDFQSRNGTVYNISISSREYHYNVGQTWQISQAGSVFMYGDGLGTGNFSNTTHLPPFVDEVNFTSAALAACNNDLACLFDSTATNDTSVGLATQRVQTVVVNERAVISNTPPVISGPTALSLVVGTPSSYVFNVTDDSGMPRVDYTASGDVTVGYSRAAYTHNITITVNSQMSSSISLLITANDSLGAVAMQQPLVIFCPCLNSQPCLPIAVGEDGGTTRSIRATCNCNQAYSGTYCQMDRDGCAGVVTNCFQGVQCVDRAAPRTGYMCGPCPSGYQGDGVTCTVVPRTQPPPVTSPENTSSSNLNWIPPVVISACLVFLALLAVVYIIYKGNVTLTYHVAKANDYYETHTSRHGKSSPDIQLTVMNPNYEDTAHGALSTFVSNGKMADAAEDGSEKDVLVNTPALEEADGNMGSQEFSERPVDVESPDRRANAPRPSNGATVPADENKGYPIIFL